MAPGYGFSHVHEPQPRKKVWNRVTSQITQVKRPVGRPKRSAPLPHVDQQLVHTMLTQAMRQDTDAFMDKALASARSKRTYPPVGVTPQHSELTTHTVEVALPGSPGYVCVHGVNLLGDCTTCNSEDTNHG